MTALMVFGPGHSTGIDLDRNAFWRLTLGAASGTEIALVVIYPPGAPANRIALAKVDIGVAKNADEIEAVAKTALTMGTLELDINRVTESMNLFKMHRNNEEEFKRALANAIELVRAYWAVRTWLEEGAATPFEYEINGWKIKGKP